MKAIRPVFLTVLFLCLAFLVWSQDSTQAFKWEAGSRKISSQEYELVFTTKGNPPWQLYAPNQVLNDVAMATISFSDSAVTTEGNFLQEGKTENAPSHIFDGVNEKTYSGAATWKQKVLIKGIVPATLQGSLLYAMGKDDNFIQDEFRFSVSLEGGVASTSRILIPSIQLRNPVNDCGDDNTEDKSLMAIFFLGFIGGLIALITPCVFPLIPLTVSFFTKRSGTKQRGIRNAFFYGICIFGIYALLSLPFHLVDKADPEIFNNISTNVTLNIIFFVIFIAFALSFFGLYEIGLPSGLATKVDARSGIGDLAGIFFMALTLAIVSFSCTGPILGSLLAGAMTNNGGAIQLTAGMSGFGLGLALPFALFALFPGWLQTLPKSGGWLTSVKVVLGFLELAMAVKFLSNADLVKQWGILRREVFIGIWIIIGFAIVLYLLGIIRFSKGNRPRMTTMRWVFVALFGAMTIYLLPGVTNTRSANLHLISGFPPPLCYSIYSHPVNCETTEKPMVNDYEKALQMSRQQHKPLLIDFTGWACVNCRRMEENIWTDPDVKALMKDSFIVVSLYVDERKKLPLNEQQVYKTKKGDDKEIITVGDKWATFQSENFNAVAQPQYAIISPDEKALTKTKSYSPSASAFADWLRCGRDAFRKQGSIK